jgi:PhzF family phenazine biosynthesis protein
MTMAITVHTVNAFVDDPAGSAIGGNPAGVVLAADELGAHQRQALAARLGLSETVFVGASANASRRLEFFTPTQQIAHCGHATIAAFWLMQHLGQIHDGLHSKETIDGNRAILIEGTRIAMEQRAPIYKDLSADASLQQVLAALQLKASDLIDGPPPAVVHTGNAFLVAGVRSRECLAAIQPQLELIRHLSDAHDLIGFYVYCLEPDMPGRHAAARMFAPRYGINEEAATGMAAGPLACWLHDRLGMTPAHFLVEQGRLMPHPSPSLIDVSLEMDSSGIERLWAGGTARLSRSQTFSLEA